MLTIHRPQLQTEGTQVRLSARFDVDGAAGELWFAVPEAHGAMLCPERADAFLVGLLVAALAQGQDLRVVRYARDGQTLVLTVARFPRLTPPE